MFGGDLAQHADSSNLELEQYEGVMNCPFCRRIALSECSIVGYAMFTLDLLTYLHAQNKGALIVALINCYV